MKSTSVAYPNPVERAAGAKKCMLVEDLTKANHRMFKALQAAEAVDKVWSIEGQMKYTKAGSEAVHRVINVFSPSEDILA